MLNLTTILSEPVRRLRIINKMLGLQTKRSIRGHSFNYLGLGLQGGCLNKMKYCCHCGKKLPEVSCEVEYESD